MLPADHRRVLAAAVGAERGDPGGLGPLDQARRHRRRPGQALPQGSKGRTSQSLLVQQPGQLHRRTAARRDRVTVDQGSGERGVPSIHDDRGRAKQQDPQQAEPPPCDRAGEPEMPGTRAVQRVHPGRGLGQQSPVRVLHSLRIGCGSRRVHEHRPVIGVWAGPAVAAARLTEQLRVPDRPVPAAPRLAAGPVIPDDDGELQPGQRRQPGQDRIRLRPPSVRTGEDDRAGTRAPQHEVHFPRPVDHHHWQQHRPAQATATWTTAPA